MTAARGWSTAVIGTVVLLAVFLLLAELSPWQITLGLGGLALLVAGWFVFGFSRADAADGAPALVAVTVLATGMIVTAYPTLAIVQALAYPIAWMFMPTFWSAVAANGAVALAVGVGLTLSLGTTPDALGQTALTVGISLAFSLAMGVWIAQLMRLGEERGRLLTELQDAQEEIAALNRDAGAGAERERLARELHDTIAQDLTGLVMLAQRARREEGRRDKTLALIEESARTALGETRALVAAGAAVAGGASPDGGPSSELELPQALERLAARFQRETGVRVSVETLRDTPELDRDREVVILRCAQEAVANARKHAGAATISIALSSQDGCARLVVEDDGCGFDPAAASDGFGLPGMAERLALVGGALAVDSAPGRGTVLTASVPVTAARVKSEAPA